MNWLFLLIAVCVAVIVYNLVVLLSGNDDKEYLNKRLSRMYHRNEADSVRDSVLKAKKKKQKKSFGWRLVSDKFEDELIAAGIQISAEEFFRIWILVSLLPPILVILINQNVITALALMVLGLIVPPLVVNQAKKKKAAKLNGQLGNALMIMSNSLRAGYSFLQAMESIAKDTPAPLSDEFKIVLREIDIGVSMEDALKHLTARTQNDDVKMLVSAVLISTQVGANLADVMDTIANTIRARLEMKDQIQVLTAQGRISGIIVGALPIVMFLLLMLINPTYIMSFVESPLGIAMLVLGVIMELIGFFVINKIVNFKY